MTDYFITSVHIPYYSLFCWAIDVMALHGIKKYTLLEVQKLYLNEFSYQSALKSACLLFVMAQLQWHLKMENGPAWSIPNFPQIIHVQGMNMHANY